MLNAYDSWKRDEEEKLESEIVFALAKSFEKDDEKKSRNPNFDYQLRLRFHKQGNLLIAGFDKNGSNPISSMSLDKKVVCGFQDFCYELRDVISKHEKDMYELRKLALYNFRLDIILRLLINPDNEDLDEIKTRLAEWKRRLSKIGAVRCLDSSLVLDCIVNEKWDELKGLIKETELKLGQGNYLKITGLKALSRFYTENSGLKSLLITPLQFYASAVDSHSLFRRDLESASQYSGEVYINLS